MGRRIFILAGLSIAVIIVAVMAFSSPVQQEFHEKTAAPLDILARAATLPPTLPPVTITSSPSISIEPDLEPTVLPATPAALTPTPVSSPTPAPKPTATPEATQTPATTPKQITGKPLSGLIIGVDPGHQLHSNSEEEPVAPGSTTMKKKVSSGTQGVFTRTPEHAINLAVGLLLKDMLQDAGAAVIMTRETADVNISNVERAQLFNKNKVDLGIRLHCNGSTDNSVTGAFMLIPNKNPYLDECKASAALILSAYGKATGIGVKKGITVRSDQTGFNWCERVIINIEMGHLTNKEEDSNLSDKDFQKKMALGIFNGIVEYFTQK